MLGYLAYICTGPAGPAVASRRKSSALRSAPPELPVYEQPAIPEAGYMWSPGYWAYDPDDGYFWVPGTWVLPPAVGLPGRQAIGAGEKAASMCGTRAIGDLISVSTAASITVTVMVASATRADTGISRSVCLQSDRQ